MKTTIVKTVLLVLVTLVMVACGGDDSPMPTKKRITNSEVISTSSSGTVTTRNYAVAYNGNLIKSYQVYSGGTVTTYTPAYNGDNKMILPASGGRNYTYDSKGRLEKSTLSSRGDVLETTFMYNTDDQIIEVISKRTRNGVEERSQRYTSTLTYQNGKLKNVLKHHPVIGYSKTSLEYDANGNVILFTEQDISGDGVTFGETVNYQITYDTNKNPTYEMLQNGGLLNANGFTPYTLYGGSKNKIFDDVYQLELGSESLYFYGKNNVMSNQRKPKAVSYDYTYDDVGYPTKLKVQYSVTYDGTTYNYSEEVNYTYENY